MQLLLRGMCLLLAMTLAGCSTLPQTDQGLRVIVLRHAEKDTSIADDPPLTQVGLQRTQRIAQRLADVDVQAVYSTDTRRTRATAKPLAQQAKRALTLYDGKQPANEFAAALRSTHHRGIVVVIGHSNTVPLLVAALCGCAVAAMSDDEYDRWSEVRIDAQGHARLLQETY